MAAIDHLILAVPNVAEGAAFIHKRTGVMPEFGGSHLGRGTCNSLVTFDDKTYFEILGPDADQPTPDGPRPFGIDELQAPKLAGYAVHPVGDETLESMAEAVRSAGFDPGARIDRSRNTPSGDVLEWVLMIGGDVAHASGGALPFGIDWLGRPSPAASLPSVGALHHLAVSHPDPRVGDALAGLALGEIVSFTIGDPGLEATIETPAGPLTLT